MKKENELSRNLKVKNSFTLIELLVKKSHLCCDREKPARGQGKARFTLPVGRVKHALPLLSFSLLLRSLQFWQRFCFRRSTPPETVPTRQAVFPI